MENPRNPTDIGPFSVSSSSSQPTLTSGASLPAQASTTNPLGAMSETLKGCQVCGRRFEVKFSFQVQSHSGGLSYFCSQACFLKWRYERHAAPPTPRSAMRAQPRTHRALSPQSPNHPPASIPLSQTALTCDTCGKHFQPKYAFQQVNLGTHTGFFCSMECRSPIIRRLEQRTNRTHSGPTRIAVLNQKGGTGKTTTTVNLAAGLADSGMKTLIIDMDAQGHIGVSLGVKGPRSLFHLIVEGIDPSECTVPIRDNLEVITSNDTLASAEIFLARMNDGRERVLRKRMQGTDDYDFVILDCGPSLSLLNMNALTYADHIIVPVSCDFLSLVGVKQILKTIKNVNQFLLHPVEILGILPTFFDRRNKISNEAVNSLKSYFKDKVLPPVRVNTRLKEAPSHKQTIFEYAPDSNGARDYRKLVDWVLAQTQPHQHAA